jgi:hypothetical protein
MLAKGRVRNDRTSTPYPSAAARSLFDELMHSVCSLGTGRRQRENGRLSLADHDMHIVAQCDTRMELT